MVRRSAKHQKTGCDPDRNSRRISCPIFAALAIILCGCAQLDYSVESTASSPPLLTTGNVSRPIGDSALDSDLPRRTTIALRDRSLSLGAALALVQAENADLIASAAGVAAVGARQIDAGKLTNPEASIYVEDIGFRPETQTTLQLSQALPLTAKLAHQQAVARGEHDVAQREADVRRLEIYGETARTFIALLVAQRRASLANDQLTLVKAAVGRPRSAGRGWPEGPLRAQPRSGGLGRGAAARRGSP